MIPLLKGADQIFVNARFFRSVFIEILFDAVTF